MMQSAKNLEHRGSDPYKYVGDSSSLLSKYDIPITHLDFDYVEKCQDRRELEKILHVLKSGEEGYYPDLMKCVEEKLRIIYPKSKFLRNLSRVISKDEVEKEEWNEITKDLNEWLAGVSQDNRELELRKGQIPPIPHETVNIREGKELQEAKETKPQQKIKSTDYAAWDKYDVDAEILEMDLKEEKLKEEAKHQSSSKKKKKQVKFNIFATDVEAKTEAKMEREKGNEYFRVGDYKSALKHYSASLDCYHTIEAFNNRAMTHLKLDEYERARIDCDFALGLDPLNVKANWRKAMALDKMHEYEKALECIIVCVDMEPNDENIQNFANKLRQKCKQTDTAKRRIRVEDANFSEDRDDSEDSEKDQIVSVPIPGTSRMPEPYLIKCKAIDSKRITEVLYTKRSDQELLTRLLDGVDSSTLSQLYPRSSNNNIHYSNSEGVVKVLHDILNSTIRNEKPPTENEQDISMRRKIKKNSRCIKNAPESTTIDDKYAGGEPCRIENFITVPEDIHSPYTFLKTWNSIRDDDTLRKQAHIIRHMNMQQIVQVIGCKLDNDMLSIVLRTLCTHFTVPGDVEKVHSVLVNIARLPRFQIISMLMSEEDKNNVNMLLSFLQQHDKILPENVKNILTT